MSADEEDLKEMETAFEDGEWDGMWTADLLAEVKRLRAIHLHPSITREPCVGNSDTTIRIHMGSTDPIHRLIIHGPLMAEGHHDRLAVFINEDGSLRVVREGEEE